MVYTCTCILHACTSCSVLRWEQGDLDSGLVIIVEYYDIIVAIVDMIIKLSPDTPMEVTRL